MRVRSALDRFSLICVLGGAIALGIYGTVWVESHAFQMYEKWQFDSVAGVDARHAGVGTQPAARELSAGLRTPPAPGSVVGELQIPRLGVSVVVLEGANAKTLRLAAGHIPGTALPGQSGNIGIAAHRDTFFRPLRNIHKNDLILLKGAGHSYPYVVESTEVVPPTDVKVLGSSGHPTLTLVTCYPFYFIGPAPKRFIVHAREIHD